MQSKSLQGRVLTYSSGFYTVLEGETVTVCKIRGRLKRGSRKQDIIAIGDLVSFENLPDGTGIIEEVLPRKNELVRMQSGVKIEYRQILISNLDQILLVFACAWPEPKLRMLDRFLVICEKQKITPIIIANKVDLTGIEQAEQIFSVYQRIGYDVVFTSINDPDSIEMLRHLIAGKVSGLVGPSGVGKSSLLNQIDTGLGLRVKEISEYNEKGQHTTVTREMFRLKEGGFIADLPGLKALALWDIEPEEIDGYFPEIRTLVQDCVYSDCAHTEEEEGCAIRTALVSGVVSEERYQSYMRMRFGEDQ